MLVVIWAIIVLSRRLLSRSFCTINAGRRDAPRPDAKGYWTNTTSPRRTFIGASAHHTDHSPPSLGPPIPRGTSHRAGGRSPPGRGALAPVHRAPRGGGYTWSPPQGSAQPRRFR